MAKVWTDIPDGSIQSGEPMKTGLMTDYRDNDEANSVKPVYIPIDENKPAAPVAYPGTADATYYAYCPEDAKALTVRAGLWGSAGTSYCKIRVSKMSGAAGYVEVENSTAATSKGSPGGSADKTYSFTGLNNVSGDDLRGQEIKLELFFKSSAGGTIDIECLNWPQSRFAVS